MFRTNREIQEEFDISKATLSRLKLFIQTHPERYSNFGVAGRYINKLALIDAMKYKSMIESGLNVPAFDPAEVRRML